MVDICSPTSPGSIDVATIASIVIEYNVPTGSVMLSARLRLGSIVNFSCQDPCSVIVTKVGMLVRVYVKVGWSTEGTMQPELCVNVAA